MKQTLILLLCLVPSALVGQESPKNYRHQGRRYRLTDVHGELVKGILA